MSPLTQRLSDHDRARELAALRLDERLRLADAVWLDEHLAGCVACAAVAADYEADSLLFAPLRDAAPVPPRDLWARTAALIDAESGGGRDRRRGRRLFGLPAISLAPLAALAAVAIVASSALLNGSPVVPPPAPSGPAPTAIAMSSSDIAVLTRTADGRVVYRTAGVDEVCPLVSERCQVAQPSFEVSQVAGISSSDNVEAIISPGRDRLVVVQRNPSGTDGVFVVPVSPKAVTATARPTAEPTDAATSAATSPTPTKATATAATTASPPPSETPSAAGSGSPSPDESATPSAATTAEPTAVPSDAPTAAPTADSTAEPTAEPTAKATPEPTPEPAVTVTPGPDGTLRIADEVIVVGGAAAYNADGSRFAFSARPADGSAGPDVYVWNTDDTKARRLTRDGRSIFTGWDGRDVLASRVVDGTPRTLAVNARTGVDRAEHGHDAWLPTISPDGTLAVWWDGSVRLADDGVTWVPDKGRLVLGGWPGDAGDVQVLARQAPASWEVRWDREGTAVGIWTADGSGKPAGTLSLYAVDAANGRAALGSPLLRNEPAFGGFSLESGRMAYAAPGRDGKRGVWVLGWKGDSVGKVQLTDDAGGTVVR